MTRFEEMSNDMAIIKYCIRKGYSSCTLLKHFQVYRCYLNYRSIGYNVTSAVTNAGKDMGVTQTWVYDIIKKMEAEV